MSTQQATPSPWVWTGSGDWWRRELRENRYQYRRLRPRVRLSDIQLAKLRDWRARDVAQAYYTPNQIRHLIRWEVGVNPPPVPTLPPGWPRDVSGHAWRPWPDVAHLNLESRPTRAPHAGGGWWEGAGRGLPLGAALLAAILLLLRAADRCLHTNLFKLPSSRRQSDEWPTPSVMATNLAARMTSDLEAGRPPSPSMQPDQVDLPPPYSECSDSATPSSAQKPEQEEPPPPYSACYVTYNNPKDRPPSVHFFTRQCQNLFANYEAGPSNIHDTGQVNIETETPVVESVSLETEPVDAQIEENHDEVVNEIEDESNAAKEAATVPQDRYLVV